MDYFLDRDILVSFFEDSLLIYQKHHRATLALYGLSFSLFKRYYLSNLVSFEEFSGTQDDVNNEDLEAFLGELQRLKLVIEKD